MRRFLAVLLGLSMLAGAASASTIHLNTAKGWTKGSNTYSNGSHSVEVSGWKYNGWHNTLTSSKPWTASWSGSHGGVGVCSQAKKHICDSDQHLVDGYHHDEMVVFDFGSKVVKLTGITLSYSDYNDKFDAFAFGNGTGSAATDHQYDIKVNGNGVVHVAINGLDTGSVFGIGAYWQHSEFKIKKIHYAAVPLPAAGLLLLAGFGGLAALKRRKAA